MEGSFHPFKEMNLYSEQEEKHNSAVLRAIRMDRSSIKKGPKQNQM